MVARAPAVAGRFYDAAPQDCLGHLKRLIPSASDLPDLPSAVLAGVVPHAGWVFSGSLAAKVFAAIAQSNSVDTFILTGSIHVVRTDLALVYDTGQWETPLGRIDIDESLAAEILNQNDPHIKAHPQSHTNEHSLEVQVPFIQYLFPEAKIVPIMTPPVPGSESVGRAIAAAVKKSDKKVVIIASTDLTHYGPSYGFTPMGTGPDALKWASQTNDKYFIDLALSMQADKLVETANLYHNACGPGAVAATLTAAKELGATSGTLLGHTNSADIIAEMYNKPSDDSVGYAAIVFT
ncbi:MAG: AmmeMemoRadiSam system protein B [Planctomycetes bacterium]|nr:AmmeMemoRadiSam system protein B [Planctomycetota bacterium]